MDEYVERVFPRRRVAIAGQNRLAQSLAVQASFVGFAVTVHAPEAERARFPEAERVVVAPYGELDAAPDDFVVVVTQHRGDREALGRALSAEAAYIALVANRTNSKRAFDKLRQDGFSEESFAGVHTPAGLDLGGASREEISLSIVAEMLAVDRRAGGRPLKETKDNIARRLPTRPALSAAAPELLIVGHGRIAEELARLGVLIGWPVTVNSPAARMDDFPLAARLVTDDLDFNAIEVTEKTFVVFATRHKDVRLSMEAAVEGKARYIGLIASQKRSGLVLDYLTHQGVPTETLAGVYAPAGLDLGCTTPSEVALSVVSEMVAVNHGASGGFLCEMAWVGAAEGAESCEGLID